MRTLLISSLSVLLATACTDDAADTTPARFAALSDEAIISAATAGLGFDAVMGQLIVFGLAFGEGSGGACNTSERDGDVVTFRGGTCPGQPGEFSGVVVASNVLGLDSAPDPERVQSITFHDFRMGWDTGGGELALDGTIRLEPEGRMVLDLTSNLIGVEVHTEASYAIVEGVLTPEAGARVTLAELGTAEIAGAWDIQNGTGHFELHGDGVLAIDLAARDGDCLPYTLDGVAAGEICNQQ